nr:MAG TPA: hypothetical protein [Caudoviricetes sp.]
MLVFNKKCDALTDRAHRDHHLSGTTLTREAMKVNKKV